MRSILVPVAASLLVGIIAGLASAYVSTQLSAKDIVHLNDKIDDLTAVVQKMLDNQTMPMINSARLDAQEKRIIRLESRSE